MVLTGGFYFIIATHVITLLSQYVNEVISSCMNEITCEWTDMSKL